jgi:hypothetical protein
MIVDVKVGLLVYPKDPRPSIVDVKWGVLIYFKEPIPMLVERRLASKYDVDIYPESKEPSPAIEDAKFKELI